MQGIGTWDMENYTPSISGLVCLLCKMIAYALPIFQPEWLCTKEKTVKEYPKPASMNHFIDVDDAREVCDFVTNELAQCHFYYGALLDAVESKS